MEPGGTYQYDSHSIENDDNMPPYLCSECSHQLMTSISFRNKMLQSHLSLQRILSKNDCITLDLIKCVNRNESIVNSDLGTAHNKMYHYNVEIEHLKNENIDPEEQICPANFPTPYEHFILDGIKKETDDMLNEGSNKNQDITHDIVYSDSLHKYMVRDGVDSEKDDEHNANNCRHQDSTNYNMEHSNEFVDGDYSSDASHAVQDERSEHTLSKTKSIAKSSSNLIQLKIDNNCKPLPEAEGNDNLSLDIRSCENTDKPFSCDICNKSFSQKSWLMKHSRIHSGERPYTCDVCKKTFNDKSNYRKHLRIHSGEKPYPCTFCEKTFNRKNYLENHLRTHSGEKPYPCGICNKLFGHKHHLKSHLRIHSGEKPYSCHVCNKHFSEKSNLHMHLKVHSGDKLYSCDECKIAFSTKYLLKCHSKIHTEKSNEN